MSRRTAEANKAIKLAWEREQDLVQNGKGTRDWTKEQQEDILNPDKGKAYDENGRAFEGQHMKSVAEHPEYQGNPDNIQFLTKEEHLDAHRGSWQNPTNWYYNPQTKEFIEFGENEIIPCQVIVLSDPIIGLHDKRSANQTISNKPNQEETKQASSLNRASFSSKTTYNAAVESTENRVTRTAVKAHRPVSQHRQTKNAHTIIKKLWEGVKDVAHYVKEDAKADPIKYLETAVDIIQLGVEIGAAKSNKTIINTSNTQTGNKGQQPKLHNTNEQAVPSPAARSITTRPYTPNDVGACPQRYHYKDGSVRWKEKAPYHREGKKG